MADLHLARPWTDVRPQLDAEHAAYGTLETRSPRDFFAVDDTSPYVVRTRTCGGSIVLTLTPAPARSASVAAYEEKPR